VSIKEGGCGEFEKRGRGLRGWRGVKGGGLGAVGPAILLYKVNGRGKEGTLGNWEREQRAVQGGGMVSICRGVLHHIKKRRGFEKGC